MSTEAIPPLSIMEYDQDDIVARLKVDPYFSAGVPILEQRLGITENDVQIAISTANNQNGLIGTVVIVLMPRLAGKDPNAPGPRYTVRYPVQVIDWPTVRRQTVGGSQVSAEAAADRIREILHGLITARLQGQTQITFDKMEPVQVKDGQISYIVTFARYGTDVPPIACAAVGISLSSSQNLITMSCQTAGAAIYYTIDGTYPSSKAATGTLYTSPFTAPPTGSTVRAAAEFVSAGYQQSNVISWAQLTGSFNADYGLNFSVTP